MQRDTKLIKDILIAVRDAREGDVEYIHQDLWMYGDYEILHVRKHYKLMQEQGLIDIIDLGLGKFVAKRLTNDGHIYLERISRSRWKVFTDYMTIKLDHVFWMMVGAVLLLIVKSFFGI